MFDLGQSVFDAVLLANPIEYVLERVASTKPGAIQLMRGSD